MLPIQRDYPVEYDRYSTQYAGQIENIGWMLYDTATYTSAATVTLRFFNAVRASRDLGNMELASQLPAGKAFLVRALRFMVKQEPRSVARAAAGTVQTGAVDNVARLGYTGAMRLIVGSKVYCEFPLWMIPAGGGAYGQYASDGDVADPGEIQDWANNGVPDVRNAYTLSKPIFIPPQMNFYVDCFWAAALTLAGGNTNVTIALDGELLRPVQ